MRTEFQSTLSVGLNCARRDLLSLFNSTLRLIVCHEVSIFIVPGSSLLVPGSSLLVPATVCQSGGLSVPSYCRYTQRHPHIDPDNRLVVFWWK